MAGSFIQTLTMVDVATGWTECCLPLVTREGSLVVEAITVAVRSSECDVPPWATMSTSQKPGGGLFQSLNVRN